MKKVMVISHERSGTHLTLNSLSKNFGYDPIENSILGDADKLSKDIAETPDNIMIKSHHNPFKFYFDDVKRSFGDVYMIYVLRDPLDVMTSCWHYFNKVDNGEFPHTKSVHDLMFTDPRKYKFHSVYGLDHSANMLDRWLCHVGFWSPHNVHTIKYEDLIYNFFGIMDEIAEGLDITKRQTYVFPDITDRGVCNRKGVVGDHKNHMAEKEIEKALTYLNDMGYDYYV